MLTITTYDKTGKREDVIQSDNLDKAVIFLADHLFSIYEDKNILSVSVLSDTGKELTVSFTDGR